MYVLYYVKTTSAVRREKQHVAVGERECEREHEYNIFEVVLSRDPQLNSFLDPLFDVW